MINSPRALKERAHREVRHIGVRACQSIVEGNVQVLQPNLMRFGGIGRVVMVMMVVVVVVLVVVCFVFL
jgi:cell division protein FtsL